MEDRDWLGITPGLTNFSKHKATVKSATLLDFSAGLLVPALGSLLSFRLSGGLSYSYFSWAARDGYLQYGQIENGNYLPLTGDDPYVPLTGTIVSYSQEWLTVPLEISILLFPGHVLSGTLSFYGGPGIKYRGLDEHHFNANTKSYSLFTDDNVWVYFIQPGAELRFSPSNRFSIALYGSWRKLTAEPPGTSAGFFQGDQGDSYASPTGMGRYEPENIGKVSGASSRFWDAGIAFKIRL
jgi:hypothetical protein